MITLVQDSLYELSEMEKNPDILQKIQSCCNYLEMCQTNVQILQSFVNDLQDFAQIKQQKLKLAISQFDILQLIQDLKNVFQIQIQKKNLQLDIVSNLKSTQFFNNDPLRIKQILFNLLSNAIKFTSKGRISITFSDDTQDIYIFCQNVQEQIQTNKSIVDINTLLKNQQRLILCTVSDNGSGMSQEIQRRLFRNFATYDNDTDMNYKMIQFINKINKQSNSSIATQTSRVLVQNVRNGVGLGLIICKQLCGYIGPLQYIYLLSQVGVGSTFQFVIYKNCDKQSYQQQDQLSVDSIDYDVSAHSPYKNIISIINLKIISQQFIQYFNTNHLTPLYKKINKRDQLQVLIVDDESFNNMLLKIQLSKIGIQKVDTAFEGKEAINMVITQCYDIVFLDFNMPGMNGLQCIIVLAQQILDIPRRNT